MSTRAMIVVGGGSSSRFGSDKLMTDVAGQPLIVHTIAALQDHVDVCVLVCRADQHDELDSLDLGVTIAPGGATRTDSEMSGLAALGGEYDLIGIHDGARPLISRQLIERLFKRADEFGAAVPVLEPGALLIDRSFLRPIQNAKTIQTPQVFRGPALLAAYAQAARAAFEGYDTVEVVHEFGDLKLDVSSHKLFKNGEEVVLTPKEFRLLEYLASRTGRALTRDEIMRNVWGSSIVVTSRSVDRCITTLRGKIEPSPRHPTYIQTIRDIGYRFEMPDVEPVVSPQPSGESPDKSRTLARGSRLGRYEIQLVLGRGGMGEVYQARDSKLDRDVAIKVLRKSLAGDPHVLLRFEQEAKAVAALSHPNILAIYDVGKEQHVTYAVTELLKGQSL
ncbi:MAG: winged helix-turn-helix domain-containing protein, partial [Acidimicrobiia bacterium]